MTLEWEEFLDPYIQAVGELKIKLRGIRKQYRKQNKHSPIEFVTGRVKPIESIKKKWLVVALLMRPWNTICRILLAYV
ncbi:GTP pyrophosphokinase [Streptococcus pneumoniae]|nr:GTP pyrophosphokinase [Streptococcus pneumoniae]